MITLSGGVRSLDNMLEAYHAAWKAFIVVNHIEAFDRSITPEALSWKVEHKISLYANLRLLGGAVTQVHIGSLDDRFIATALLRKSYGGMRFIKIMERRPGAHDQLGLDSIDYRVIDINKTFDILKATGAKVEKEFNNAHTWLSLRFGRNHEFEAKFIDHSLIDIAIAELNEANEQLSH